MNNRSEKVCYFMIVDEDSKWSQLFYTDMVVIVVSSIFSVIATCANAIVLWTIRRTPSLHTPSYAVLSCLALSDLLVGLLAQPLVVVVKISAALGTFNCTLWTVKEAISWLLSAVSFLTMVLVGVERYLALYLHLKYLQLVTIPRICMLYAGFYFFSAFVVGIWLAGVHERTMGILVVVMVITCLAIILTVQHKILKLVRQHQAQIQEQVNAVNLSSKSKRSALDFNKYKKSTATMMLVVLLSVVLYIPFVCIKAILSLQGFTVQVICAYDITWALVHINSSINPCIYCLRMKEIRHFVSVQLSSLGRLTRASRNPSC